MALATSTILATVAATAALAGGAQQYQAGKQQANAATASAEMAAEEQVRTSALQASQEKRAAEDARAKQKLGFLKSGVSLEGSPLLMMEETRLQGARNVEEVQQAGASGAASTLAEGRTTAKSYKSQGRAALIGGLSSAASTASNMNFGGG